MSPLVAQTSLDHVNVIGRRLHCSDRSDIGDAHVLAGIKPQVPLLR